MNPEITKTLDRIDSKLDRHIEKTMKRNIALGLLIDKWRGTAVTVNTDYDGAPPQPGRKETLQQCANELEKSLQ